MVSLTLFYSLLKLDLLYHVLSLWKAAKKRFAGFSMRYAVQALS